MSARSYFDCRVTTSCKHETLSGLFFDMYGNLAVPAIWRAKEHVNDLEVLRSRRMASLFLDTLGGCSNQVLL